MKRKSMLLRLPEAVRKRLKKLSKEKGISMNALILYALEDFLKMPTILLVLSLFLAGCGDDAKAPVGGNTLPTPAPSCLDQKLMTEAASLNLDISRLHLTSTSCEVVSFRIQSPTSSTFDASDESQMDVTLCPEFLMPQNGDLSWISVCGLGPNHNVRTDQEPL